jgi:glutaredoxin
VKEFLSREGVAFEAKNVDEDEQAYTELIAKGYRTIPVTFIGDTVIKGFDQPALAAALAARKGPPPTAD